MGSVAAAAAAAAGCPSDTVSLWDADSGVWEAGAPCLLLGLFLQAVVFRKGPLLGAGCACKCTLKNSSLSPQLIFQCWLRETLQSLRT